MHILHPEDHLKKATHTTIVQIFQHGELVLGLANVIWKEKNRIRQFEDTGNAFKFQNNLHLLTDFEKQAEQPLNHQEPQRRMHSNSNTNPNPRKSPPSMIGQENQ
jgi:hypothetical protein